YSRRGYCIPDPNYIVFACAHGLVDAGNDVEVVALRNSDHRDHLGSAHADRRCDQHDHLRRADGRPLFSEHRDRMVLRQTTAQGRRDHRARHDGMKGVESRRWKVRLELPLSTFYFLLSTPYFLLSAFDFLLPTP